MCPPQENRLWYKDLLSIWRFKEFISHHTGVGCKPVLMGEFLLHPLEKEFHYAETAGHGVEECFDPFKKYCLTTVLLKMHVHS